MTKRKKSPSWHSTATTAPTIATRPAVKYHDQLALEEKKQLREAAAQRKRISEQRREREAAKREQLRREVEQAAAPLIDQPVLTGKQLKAYRGRVLGAMQWRRHEGVL